MIEAKLPPKLPQWMKAHVDLGSVDRVALRHKGNAGAS
jgi:hypothetical protein